MSFREAPYWAQGFLCHGVGQENPIGQPGQLTEPAASGVGQHTWYNGEQSTIVPRGMWERMNHLPGRRLGSRKGSLGDWDFIPTGDGEIYAH